MIFASFEFLCLYLPVFLATYFLTPAGWRNWQILLFSWAFYAWWRVDFLLLLAGVTVFTFAVARWMDDGAERVGRGRAGSGGGARQAKLVLGLVGNLGVLATFKYANFGVDAFNEALAPFGFSPIAWTRIVLPIGLSFYVLQSVSYLVDVYRGDVPVSRNFVNYAAYKALFVQLIAGPIVRYAEIEQDLKHRRYSLAQFGRGARRFMIGFAMKVCLADALAPVVDAVFGLAEPSLADAWLGGLAYTLQLYFDFAGYSAMAIGLADIMGFHFPENFNNPYLAGSIQSFWQRWHMTLSRFLRDYLYIPLGGNRARPWRVYANLGLTMLIGGFWHGANWTFLIWGAWQGGLLAVDRAWRRRAPDARPMPWIVGHGLTMLAVLLGWVVFRAADLAAAGRVYGGMLGLHGVGLSDDLAWQIAPDQWGFLGLAILIIYAPLAAPAAAPLWRGAAGWMRGVAWVLGPMLAFGVGVVLLYSRAAVPFLYFQF